MAHRKAAFIKTAYLCILKKAYFRNNRSRVAAKQSTKNTIAMYFVTLAKIASLVLLLFLPKKVSEPPVIAPERPPSRLFCINTITMIANEAKISKMPRTLSRAPRSQPPFDIDSFSSALVFYHSAPKKARLFLSFFKKDAFFLLFRIEYSQQKLLLILMRLQGRLLRRLCVLHRRFYFLKISSPVS